MLQSYLKIAWRNLQKNKVTSFINIAGLAIGMAVAMMIGLWLKDELTFNQYHKNYEHIAQLLIHQKHNNEIRSSRAISLPTAPTLRENFGENFENIALASWNYQHTLANEDKVFIREGMHVESDFPAMFSLDMIAGTYEDALTSPNSIILSQSLATALFGEEDPMGQTVRYDAVSDLKVTGVFRDLPSNTEMQESHFFVDWEYYRTQNEWVRGAEESWGNHSFQMYAQITKQTDFAAVSEKIRDIEKEHNPEANPEYFLFPMAKWHLYSQFREGKNIGGRIQFVWMFGIIGVFVLLLACINFMNLSTARSEKRAREVGIRKTIGSMRSQLIGQFLSESLLVTFIAIFLSLALVQLSLGWFNNLADKSMQLPWTAPLFWVLFVGFTVVTGIIAGSYPAFYLSSFNPLKAIKGTFRAGAWAAVPRKVLVTVQFTVSIALIIGTIVVYQQIQYAKNRPVGYEREGIIQFFDNQELMGKYDVLRNDLLQTGVVKEIAQSSGPITDIWSNQSGFDWEGKDPEFLPSFGVTACSYEFGETVGWEILEGRDFSREYSMDTSSLILNESAIELIGIQDIVGKSITYSGSDRQVIGIVRDMVMESPYRPIKPTVFLIDPGWTNLHTVRFKEGVSTKEALASVEQVFSKHSTNTPFEYKFVDEAYEEKFRAEERIGSLAKVFAFLAILISCLGLFGLSAFVAERRTKEIGIRKVLGATVTNLWAMQSKGFIGLVLLSCLIATPLAWYFLRGWLSDYEYRIEINGYVFVAAAFLALVVTLLTVSYQSIRAALANPVDSLKTE